MNNVVVMLADQLRADCLGCYGNRVVQTPHIDQLALNGIRFESAFAQHPQCVPSRSSLITGRYPHVNGAISNHVAMAPNEVTLPEYLQEHGFFTAAIGKVHLYPLKERSSYQYTMLCGGQTSNRTTPAHLRSDYRHWLRANGYWETVCRHYANRELPAYRENFQAVVSPLPVEAYYDAWVGDRAVEFIRDQTLSRQPFYLFVGFPNPHNPFEPPEPYASMYDPADMTVPATFHSDLGGKPPQHRNYKAHGRASLGLDFNALTEDKLRRVIAHYYGSITLVDDQVGKIIGALEEARLMNDTIVVFLADHGELLGHHGMLLKSQDAYPMLYDKSLHVPFIVSAPDVGAGPMVAPPVELVDYYPTLLDLLEIPIPPEVQGRSLAPAMRCEADNPVEFVFAESGAVKMVRGSRHKLVYYPGQPYGELYDLELDPLELRNLYDDGDHAAVRSRMIQALADRLIAMEAPRHGESSQGAAYWRRHYRLPFQPQHGQSTS